MMILAYLLSTSLAWRQAEVRLKVVVPDKAAAVQTRKNLTSIVQRIRTNAVPEVLVSDRRSFQTILRESSSDADLIFMGMAKPSDPDFLTKYYAKLETWIEGLPTVVLVLAAEATPFGEVLVQSDVTMHQGS